MPSLPFTACKLYTICRDLKAHPVISTLSRDLRSFFLISGASMIIHYPSSGSRLTAIEDRVSLQSGRNTRPTPLWPPQTATAHHHRYTHPLRSILHPALVFPSSREMVQPASHSELIPSLTGTGPISLPTPM